MNLDRISSIFFIFNLMKNDEFFSFSFHDLQFYLSNSSEVFLYDLSLIFPGLDLFVEYIFLNMPISPEI